jgi:small subunit ribosomal protein S17e
VDRVTRLSIQVLEKHKDRFTDDFTQNKKILDQLAIVRSKGLKNEIAGYITKHVKKQMDVKAAKEEREREEIEAEVEQKTAEETSEVEETSEETIEETTESAEMTQEDSEPQEILLENQGQESS